ncbi:MAG: hypothetical protein EOP04_26480, partial [Proteobacteria bacterium]
RAVVVGGDHTFGKGSVQSVLPMPNNLGLKKRASVQAVSERKFDRGVFR